jgi:hypothetical protein
MCSLARSHVCWLTHRAVTGCAWLGRDLFSMTLHGFRGNAGSLGGGRHGWSLLGFGLALLGLALLLAAGRSFAGLLAGLLSGLLAGLLPARCMENSRVSCLLADVNVRPHLGFLRAFLQLVRLLARSLVSWIASLLVHSLLPACAR